LSNQVLSTTDEAQALIPKIHSSSKQETAKENIATERLNYDQELISKITETLKIRHFYDLKKTACTYCSWPQDYEQDVENIFLKITNEDKKSEARTLIDEAWAQYILEQKYGEEGKKYLDKITNQKIREKAKGYIDAVLLGQVNSRAKERKFDEAKALIQKIHSSSTQETAKGNIATERQDYDQELISQITNTLKIRHVYDLNKLACTYCSWPQDYEQDVENIFLKITNEDKKSEARNLIDEAWAQYILEQKYGEEGKKYLDKIKSEKIKEKAIRHIDKLLVEQVQSFGKKREFEKAQKLISAIHFSNARIKARQHIDNALIEQINILRNNKQFDEAHTLATKIHSSSIKEKTMEDIASKKLDYDQELISQIEAKLEKKRSFDPNDSSVENLFAKISNREKQLAARKLIDEAWAQYILEKKYGVEGKPYLDKIKSEKIKEKAKEYIDAVLLEQVNSRAKEKKFDEAHALAEQIYSSSTRDKAKEDIETQRLDTDEVWTRHKMDNNVKTNPETGAPLFSSTLVAPPLFTLGAMYQSRNMVDQNVEKTAIPERIRENSFYAENESDYFQEEETYEKTADHVDDIAKNSLRNTLNFSTSFKVVAGIVIGASIAYAAIKTYQYYMSKSQKTKKTPQKQGLTTPRIRPQKPIHSMTYIQKSRT
jgi:uncharacterized membrane protein YebE (DUF533 family)